jgi:hypothetical protein
MVQTFNAELILASADAELIQDTETKKDIPPDASTEFDLSRHMQLATAGAS